jgi:parvulin-like peptidyl-prolyl isomerase
MRRAIFIFVFVMVAAHGPQAFGASAPPQSARIVDRIVARIEDDIILQSQVRELGAFQQLIEGHAESDDMLLEELIEQWVVQTEATASHFPQPAQSEVDREATRLREHFASPENYASRLNELGLSASQVRELLSRQIYVERYVDYKFRPSVQIEPADIDAYYKKELLPELAKKNQPAPDRASVEEQVRELLIQRGISDLTAKWLDDTKSRLKIGIETAGGKP